MHQFNRKSGIVVMFQIDFYYPKCHVFHASKRKAKYNFKKILFKVFRLMR